MIKKALDHSERFHCNENPLRVSRNEGLVRELDTRRQQQQQSTAHNVT
jgi:hypothetical protein